MNHLNDDDGLIDPARLDVAAAKPRRRDRTRRDPPKELTDAKPAMLKAAHARNHPPGVMKVRNSKGRNQWSAPHNDADLWRLQLGQCFGTRSDGLINTFLRQLEALLDGTWDAEEERWWANERQFAAVLDLISGLKPRNSMEAALAAQMVAVHLLTMKVGAHAIRHEYDHRQAAVLSKLARTFAGQTETLQNLQGRRRKGSQTIKVKKEISYHVHQHRYDHGGSADFNGRPHERGDATSAEIAAGCPALPSPDPQGNVVPLPRSKGKGAV